MDKSKRKRIWDFAQKVREVLKLSTPVRLDDLCAAIQRLGGRVDATQPALREASIKRDEGSFVVFLDPSMPARRRVFSLAHEIGHLFLHMGFGNPSKWDAQSYYINSYARHGYSEEELEANEFAGALLMPTAEFEERAKLTPDCETMAEHFGVSPSAALIRGRHLQVYEWT